MRSLLRTSRVALLLGQSLSSRDFDGRLGERRLQMGLRCEHVAPDAIPRQPARRAGATPCRALSCDRIGTGTPLAACRLYTGGTRVWLLLVLHGVTLVWTVRLVGTQNLLNLLLDELGIPRPR